jgi:hypothetical protein
MVLLWPLLLVGAGVIAWKARAARPPRFGGPWLYVAWGLAGVLFMFSLVTGFSIGLAVFPLAVLAVFWLAANAPGREAIGFLAGALAVLLVLLVPD